MRSLFLLIAALVVFSDTALAAPGELRTVTGTLQWPSTLSDQPIAVVRGDDGTLYYVEVSAAERRGTVISGRVSVIGTEGTRAQDVTAVVIGAGDSALAPVQPPQGSTPADVAASPRTETVDDLWRVQGKVRAVSVTDIVVETAQGQAVRVDASRLSSWTRQELRAGDEVKLYGVPQPDNQLVANGFIQLMPAGPAASSR
jgi:hypothetical protein